MTTAPAHTPYDGSSKPFAIGLKPIGFERWIEIDAHYPAYLQEKRRLYAQVPEKVFVAEPGTEAAQQEVSDLIAGHLHRHFPNLPAVPLPEPAGNALREHPLYRASLRVQEDLILMRRGETGWRLAAGSLCFPSSWSLREKFGRPLEQIHVPVPGFGPGSRPDLLIARMFDALSPEQLMERYNWSIQAGDALYLPLSDEARRARGKPAVEIPRWRPRRPRLHPRRAADAAQAPFLARRAIYHPHPPRPAEGAGRASRTGKAGFELCRATRRPRRRTARLQGHDGGPRPAGGTPAFHDRQRLNPFRFALTRPSL